MNLRRSVPLALSLTLCMLALAVLLIAVQDNAVALATPRYVAETGVDSGDCAVGASPCASIQYAVDRADEGDTIKVAGGTYKGVDTRPVPPYYSGAPASGVVTQVVYLTKTLFIEGGYTAPLYADPPDPVANPTTLDAEDAGRVFMISGDIGPTLEGLRITGGEAEGQGGDDWLNDVGGGIYIDSATVMITSTRVFSNVAERGAGLFVWDLADLTMRDSEVLTNTATDYAGGIHAHFSQVKLQGNLISGNSGWVGGGVGVIYGDRSELAGNTVISNKATSGGGGLRILGSWPVTLTANLIAGNSAAYAGGADIYDSEVLLVNNVVVGNQARDTGSGLFIQRSRAELLHTTIADNSQGEGTGVNVVGLPGNRSIVTFTNTILVSHTVGIDVAAGNTATLEATLWHGNTDDSGGGGSLTLTEPNVDGDPDFVNPASWDYHLGRSSAAINAGVDAGTDVDIDGHPRPLRGAFDLGADEALALIYLPIVFRK